jgi:hypothetical protein
MARRVRPGGRIVGHNVVRGVGLRQDVAIGMFRRAGAGPRIDRLHRSGAVVHVAAMRPGVTGS